MPKFGQYSYQPVANTGVSPPSGMEMERMEAQTQQARMNMRQQFQQQKRDESVRNNMGAAMAGDVNALDAIYSANPEAGMQVEQRRAEQQQAQQQQMMVQNQMINNAAAMGATPQELDMIAGGQMGYGQQAPQMMGQFEGPQQFVEPPQTEITRQRLAQLMAGTGKRDIRTVDGSLIEIGAPGTEPDVLYQAEGDGFGFEGTGMTAQSMNTVLKGLEQEGATPQELSLAKTQLSQRYLSREKTMMTEQGMLTIPGLDLTGLTTRSPQATEAATGEKLTSQQSKTQSVMSGSIIPGTEKTPPLQREYNKGFSTLSNMGKTVNNYRTVLDKLGPQMALGRWNAVDEQKLKSAYKALQIDIKDLAELGVLAGPDMQLIEDWVQDPTTAGAMMTGKAGLMAGVAELSNYLDNKRSTFQEQYQGLNVKTRSFDIKKPPIFEQTSPTSIIYEGKTYTGTPEQIAAMKAKIGVK